MATQEQVNIEVGKLYAQMADYISRKVQGSDTFSGLSGNQHAELDAIAQDLSASIRNLEIGTRRQKHEAMNTIGNEVAGMLVAVPNSPYSQYSPQQVNVLSMQSTLGGEKEYLAFAKGLNASAFELTARLPFLRELQKSIADWYSTLNGNRGIIEDSGIGRRTNAHTLVGLNLLSQKDQNEISTSDQSTEDLLKGMQIQLNTIAVLSKNYFNVNEDLIIRENLALLIPLIPEIAVSVKALVAVVVACAGTTAIHITKDTMDARDAELADNFTQQTLSHQHDFCEKVNEALSVVYDKTKSLIESALISFENGEVSLDGIFQILQSLKKSQSTSDALTKLINKDSYRDPTDSDKFLEFSYLKHCVMGQVQNAGLVIDVIKAIPTDVSGYTENEKKQKLNLIAMTFGKGGEVFRIAAQNAKKAEEEARQKSSLADAARRRRAVTHLIEWATYGAVSVGVIWGLSKVYKSYKSEEA
jgi:hypothetical protein